MTLVGAGSTDRVTDFWRIRKGRREELGRGSGVDRAGDDDEEEVISMVV